MKVIVDLCVLPIGVGVNLAPYVATCERVLLDAGLKIKLHANGTAIEGEWDQVFNGIRSCHEQLHESGCARLFSTIHLNTRIDREQSLEDKIASVEAILRE
jgi:uncharacterized protein (TIGR00106 family)